MVVIHDEGGILASASDFWMRAGGRATGRRPAPAAAGGAARDKSGWTRSRLVLGVAISLDFQ
jgi:hypothetical protein